MKKVKKTGMLLLVFAIVLGAIAGIISLTLVKSAYKEVSVFVAKHEIEEGDPLSMDLFEKKMIHPTGRPDKAVVVEGLDLNGVITSSGLLPGDILREEHLIKISDSNQELPLISTRVKAIGDDNLVGAEIPINSIGGILGGIKKGDMITVVSVIENKETKQIISKTILVNVEVVSVKTGAEEDATSDTGVVAVALTQNEFKKLSLARDLGNIHVAIQPLGVLLDESLVEELTSSIKTVEVDI